MCAVEPCLWLEKTLHVGPDGNPASYLGRLVAYNALRYLTPKVD